MNFNKQLLSLEKIAKKLGYPAVLWPAGAWTNMDSQNPSTKEVAKKLLEKHIPAGGTILEICCGACDFMCEIADLQTWDMYATDIQAKSFKTVSRSESKNIKLFNISIQDLFKHNFNKKFDVLMAHNGPYSDFDTLDLKENGTTLNKSMEAWTFKNFNYLICNSLNDKFRSAWLDGHMYCAGISVHVKLLDVMSSATGDNWHLYKLN